MDRKAFYKVSYGLYIVSTKVDEKLNGYISNSVFQITSEPPQFAITCHKDNYTATLIKQSNKCAISVIHKDVRPELIREFGFKSGRDTDKFANVNYKLGETGIPIVLDGTIASIEFEITNSYDQGTHILFIGKVISSEILNEDIEPLTYAYYSNVIKGIAPKNAPTFQEIEKTLSKNSEDYSKHRCTICNYIYNPAEGDPNAEIPPDTDFKDLPDDWTCPICGATKSEFRLES